MEALAESGIAPMIEMGWMIEAMTIVGKIAGEVAANRMYLKFEGQVVVAEGRKSVDSCQQADVVDSAW